jgi:hypothetical protein
LNKLENAGQENKENISQKNVHYGHEQHCRQNESPDINGGSIYLLYYASHLIFGHILPQREQKVSTRIADVTSMSRDISFYNELTTLRQLREPQLPRALSKSR